MRGWLTVLAILALAPSARANDVVASAPRSISVTLYRDPDRRQGSLALDSLGGFALVTETRLVHLPPGETRLRFEGVVDGIVPASAIVTGLPGGVIEKNRDAALLSPASLVRAAKGAGVMLVRTNPKTGKVTRTRATIRSANGQTVVFQTAEGIEALHCSGLPETFEFERIPAGLSSKPTLSVLTRTGREVTATVTLSYLADGFDWAANYVAHINPGGRTLNLSAWITLANGNTVSLADAKTQIVAGRLNRAGSDAATSGEDESEIAQCWPQGTTSDGVAPPPNEIPPPPAPAPATMIIVTAGKRSTNVQGVPIVAEQLGDLKLYRVPRTTTVAAMESKQVLFLEQPKVAFERLASIDLQSNGTMETAPALAMFRTKNTLANDLGLPLPSGAVTVFDNVGARDLLVGASGLKDTAVGEDVELTIGRTADIQVHQTALDYTAKSPDLVPLTPELGLAFHHGDLVEEVDITSGRGTPTPFELRLRTYGDQRITAADQPMAMKDGRPIFRLTLPANGEVKVRYTVSQ